MSGTSSRWTRVSILALCSLALLGAAPGQAQSTSRAFPETGKTVSGRFLDYWNSHGGLVQQGFPISGEMQETSFTDGKTYTVQYFERAVFEYHPEFQPPNDVLLSLLGSLHYSQEYPAGAPDQQPVTSATSGSFGSIKVTRLRHFPETNHYVSGKFLDYWEAHGGLAQQGYPISDQFQEVSLLDERTYWVQYFQRAVFEYHPENVPPYDVLLSQLGTFRYRHLYVSGPTPGPSITATPIGVSVPATPTPSATPIATPTATPSNTPRPTKTPVPTVCPDFTGVSLECGIRADFGIWYRWSASGGGGQVAGVLTIHEQGGRISTRTITERDGGSVYYAACGWDQVQVDFSLEMHDECGQTTNASTSYDGSREPCP